MFPTKEMTEDEFLTFIRGKIVAVAQAIIDEEIGVIAGSRKLSAYSSQLYTVKTENLDEEYFTLLDALASEMMHLPVDWERKNWRVDALNRKDAEIAEFEAQVKEKIFEACRVLIRRYEVAFPCT
jgi:predicted cation transporter